MPLLSSSINEYYNYTIDELIKTFEADLDKGLNSSDIKKKQLEFGFNELPRVKKSIWKLYLAPIFNFLIVVKDMFVPNMKLILSWNPMPDARIPNPIRLPSGSFPP